MIRACDDILLNIACESLGRMLDFAANSMHIDPATMLRLFIASGAAADFESGDLRITTGMSGVELVYEVLDRSGIEYERRSQRHTAALSAEYHLGYALAALQRNQGLSFDEIIGALNISELPKMYQDKKTSLLEALPWNASEDEKRDALDNLAAGYADLLTQLYLENADRSSTRLQEMRIKNGLSQSQLAKASAVPLRTIQQYEQRQKNINRARAEYLIMLSSALSCDPSLLLERD